MIERSRVVQAARPDIGGPEAVEFGAPSYSVEDLEA
jgi:hypothetical protein